MVFGCFISHSNTKQFRAASLLFLLFYPRITGETSLCKQHFRADVGWHARDLCMPVLSQHGLCLSRFFPNFFHSVNSSRDSGPSDFTKKSSFFWALRSPTVPAVPDVPFVGSHPGFRLILFFFFIIRQPPTLPYRLQYSTIGRAGLNHRVRDGNGCVPCAHRHRKYLVVTIFYCLTISLFDNSTV